MMGAVLAAVMAATFGTGRASAAEGQAVEGRAVEGRAVEGRPAEGPLTILTLSSYHGDLPFARIVEAGVREAVTRANPLNRVYFEYLDAARFDLAGFSGEFAALLDRKYRAVRPDTVILWADDAVSFADRHWGRSTPTGSWRSRSRTTRWRGCAGTLPASPP